MSENERLANELVVEIGRAVAMYQVNQWTAEQFLIRLRQIIKAANLV